MKFKPGTFCTVPNKQILTGLPPQAQVLFFWLCAHSDKDGVCFPSASKLAKECGIGRVTVFKYLTVLEGCGLILRYERFSKTGKTSNYYQIILVDPDTSPSVVVQEANDLGSPVESSLVPGVNSNYIQSNKNQLLLSGGAGRVGVDKDTPVAPKPFSLPEALAELCRRPSPVHRIAGLLMTMKGFPYANQKQFNAAFGEATRAAKQLEGYSSQEITTAIRFTQEQADRLRYPWRFWTVFKNIESVVNQKNTPSSDINRARILQDKVDKKIT